MVAPVPNFPGIGPIGNVSIADGVGSNNPASVTADNMLWVGGAVIYSMLAEMRVQTQMLQIIANNSDNLAQLRADAVADMAPLYVGPETTPVLSS